MDEQTAGAWSTACESTLTTPDTLRWDDQQRRFYWRTIAYVLHTNARKHTLYRQWLPHCRLCPEIRDTQGHRFGIGSVPCSAVLSVYEECSVALEEVCCRLWMPDQEGYIPGRSHELARSSGRPTRAWWVSGLYAVSVNTDGRTSRELVGPCQTYRGWSKTGNGPNMLATSFIWRPSGPPGDSQDDFYLFSFKVL